MKVRHASQANDAGVMNSTVEEAEDGVRHPCSQPVPRQPLRSDPRIVQDPNFRRARLMPATQLLNAAFEVCLPGKANETSHRGGVETLGLAPGVEGGSRGSRLALPFGPERGPLSWRMHFLWRTLWQQGGVSFRSDAWSN